MKKKCSFIALSFALIVLSSCGGSKPAPKNVNLGNLDDYFTVLSYTLETNAKEKGLDHLDDVTGTLTLVVQRNKEEMKLKASDIEYAKVYGKLESTGYYAFSGKGTPLAKQLLKVEPGKKETVTVNIVGSDPGSSYNSAEKNASIRQRHLDAFFNPSQFDEIELSIEWKEDISAALETLQDLKDILDDDDD